MSLQPNRALASQAASPGYFGGVDPAMYVFAYIAALAIVALGGALTVSPVRSTRALHEWYIVPPEVRPGQRVGLLECRMVGVALLVGGATFAARITHAVFSTF
jgi:hypothetical protein